MSMNVVSLPPPKPPAPKNRLIRLRCVTEVTGMGKSAIYEKMRLGEFPKSVRLSSRMVAWPESAVFQWVQDRITESQAAQAQGGAQ